MTVTEYELQREKNIAANRALLEELRLTSNIAFNAASGGSGQKLAKQGQSQKAKRIPTSRENHVPRKRLPPPELFPERRSSRIQTRKPTIRYRLHDDSDSQAEEDEPTGSRRRKGIDKEYEDVEDDEESDEDVDDEDRPRIGKNGLPVQRRVKMPNFPKWNGGNIFGPIPGIPIGAHWETRLEASYVGVHRPTVAGIHGSAEGCYSVALSGGYEDDVDMGDCFTFTGSGGRDLRGTKDKPKNLRSAPQSKDQSLNTSNLSLTVSAKTKTPVRVIRGYKLDSPYAPESGYRYDGLYTVQRAWTEVGMAGFLVYKFAFLRIEGQPPIGELAECSPAPELPSGEPNKESDEEKINIETLPEKDEAAPTLKPKRGRKRQNEALDSVEPTGQDEEHSDINDKIKNKEDKDKGKSNPRAKKQKDDSYDLCDVAVSIPIAEDDVDVIEIVAKNFASKSTKRKQGQEPKSKNPKRVAQKTASNTESETGIITSPHKGDEVATDTNANETRKKGPTTARPKNGRDRKGNSTKSDDAMADDDAVIAAADQETACNEDEAQRDTEKKPDHTKEQKKSSKNAREQVNPPQASEPDKENIIIVDSKITKHAPILNVIKTQRRKRSNAKSSSLKDTSNDIKPFPDVSNTKSIDDQMTFREKRAARRRQENSEL